MLYQKPVVATKLHRRSKSSEIWLDHRPPGTVEIGWCASAAIVFNPVRAVLTRVASYTLKYVELSLPQ